jgi:hypothetical protein
MRALKLTMLVASILCGSMALAERLELPAGMGGVADIGAIPCSVFSEMLGVGPLGTRHSLLTWADGYYYAQTQKTIDELLAATEQAGESWDFDRLTDHFVDYCAENPEAITRDAVISLGAQLIPN